MTGRTWIDHRGKIRVNTMFLTNQMNQYEFIRNICMSENENKTLHLISCSCLWKFAESHFHSHPFILKCRIFFELDINLDEISEETARLALSYTRLSSQITECVRKISQYLCIEVKKELTQQQQ